MKLLIKGHIVIKKTLLQQAGFASLALGLAFSATSALAQEAADPVDVNDNGEMTKAEAEQQAQSGTIMVTGSRIARPEFSGTLPGVQITEEQIKARGFTNALEALNDIPLVGPGASPLNGNNGGQAASLGAAFVDLLDLGTNRTLTLVNGRRFVSGNSATLFVEGNTTGGQVDINAIPATLIKRVDVVTVGGAATYGSDAIAGVVNFILDDEFEGVEANASNGISTYGDASQYQLNLTAGKNFADGRINITVSGEYSFSEGLQSDAREFRLRRATTTTNFANGTRRNPAFASAIIDVQNANNGAFLRASDDGIPANGLIAGSVNQSLSFNGTVLRALNAAPLTFYTPNAANFINLRNGVGPTGTSLPNTVAGTAQIINGQPGAQLIAGNGLNGRTTPATGLAITTFAPTALPAGVTAAQVFTQFGITPPATATATQLTALAVNVLQANRPTAREFFAQNPNVPTNYFLGTFVPNVPRVANTDTTLVTVAGVQVPVNQVLPFVAVPLEFNADGSLRAYNAGSVTQGGQGSLNQLAGGDGGFLRAIENTVLRTEQERIIGNLFAKWDVTDNITLFGEGLYARIENTSLRNSTSQNFLSTAAEAAALVLNVDNPYLTAQNRTVLESVGINAATNGGSFVTTRQNQDIFGDNPFVNTSETYRLVGGVRGNWEMFGRDWSSEFSATYGRSKQITETTALRDIEYQLALDAVFDPATNTIRCRAQLFPNQYLGRIPTGTQSNVTKIRGADGILQEGTTLPVITQSMIDGCAPLNPFGFNNMSDASKRYVRADAQFTNISTQLFLQGTVTGGLFDLPAGEVVISGTAEYRKESLDFVSNEINQLGRTRNAPSVATAGEIEVFEFGGEARIPLTGEDFLPFLGNLELSPSIRVSNQDGQAETFRNAAGNLVTPSSSGTPQTIWSIAGTWQPIRDILLRGNITRSIRQPSIVELFLGGQSAFTTPTDVCGPASIGQGSSATLRRNNCRRAVIDLGLAADNTAADTFLATFVPAGVSLPGTFSGAAGLLPERGSSWTAGVVLTPRWIPRLQISADYISLDLDNTIQPTNLAQAITFCYDSAVYNDTSAVTGANTCTFFSRQANDFQVAPFFASGFINLAATQIRALNISANYNFDLPANIGNLSLSGNAYHLIAFDESANGTFSDVISSAGTFSRPSWEVQSRARYEKDSVFAQVVWNWRQATKLFASGLPATVEVWQNPDFPAISTFDAALGADVTEKIRLQLNVFNVTNKLFAGENGLFQGAFVDQIGRRFLVTAGVKF